MKRFLVLAGILIGVSAFFYFRSIVPEIPTTFTAAHPGRDEVCASGKLRLSMNSYEALLSKYPRLRPIDRVRIGLYAQWLREARAQDPNALKDATRCVRALMKPNLSVSENQKAEALVRSAFGLTSLKELEMQINDAWNNRTIEWNHSLVKEYGIELPESLGNSG